MREFAGRDFFILLTLCVVGAMLGRMQSGARLQNRIDPVSGMIRATTNPLAATLTGAANSTSDFLGGIFGAAELSRQVKSLKQFEIIAKQYGETVDRLNKEILSLRSLNNLPPIPGREKVVATVIGYFATENRITISVGKNKGMKPGLAVLTGDGLVGTIQTVGETDSQVSLLSDPNRKIGALVTSRNPPSPGIIKGETTSVLVLTIDASLPVENGDLVTTWGFSGLIPRGIPIGRVNQVYPDPTTGSKRVEVFPNASLGSMREVVIIK